jgi:hypothetical protein
VSNKRKILVDQLIWLTVSRAKKFPCPLFNLKGYMFNLLQGIRRDGADLCDV